MSDLRYDYPRPFTILYLESDETLRSDVVDLLGMFYQPTRIIEVDNGLEVMPQALAHQPDVIISDIAHVGLWGHLVFAELRRHPRTGQVPFIFLSAADPEHFASVLYESGLRPPDSFIRKPFHPNHIRAALCEVFSFMMEYRGFWYNQ
ncbi:MAG: response regulator [Anaerolineae bacterium]|nr:response regulator [Anaerolineae bacterium]